MSWLMAIFTFLNAWWITLFVTVPLCIERPRENPADPLVYPAAPTRIHWRRLVRLNTVVAVVATAMLALVINSGIVPVR
jgi:predicted secreted protein